VLLRLLRFSIAALAAGLASLALAGAACAQATFQTSAPSAILMDFDT
jgi:hypothetical protein